MSKPIEIGNKSVSVSMYHEKDKKGYENWRVIWWFNGRCRKRFTDRAKAEAFGKQTADDISNGQFSLRFGAEERASYARAIELLQPTGMSLELVAAERLEIFNILGAVSPVDAARDYAKRHAMAAKPVHEVVQEFLAMKESRGRSLEYTRIMRLCLERFAKAFTIDLGALTGADVQAWLAKMDVSDRTRANEFNHVKNVFKFAKSRKYLLRDNDELDSVFVPRPKPGKSNPFTPEETAKILDYAEKYKPKWLPYLAIRAFTGLRTEEVGRLRKEHFHIEEQCITADADITKTATKRIMPIHPALEAYLEQYPIRVPIQPYVNNHSMAARFHELLKAVGVATRHNGFRDSYASFRFAVLQDPGKVTAETGHSVAQFLRSYQSIRLADGRVITPKVGAEYFAIRPKLCPESVPKLTLLQKAQ